MHLCCTYHSSISTMLTLCSLRGESILLLLLFYRIIRRLKRFEFQSVIVLLKISYFHLSISLCVRFRDSAAMNDYSVFDSFFRNPRCHVQALVRNISRVDERRRRSHVKYGTLYKSLLKVKYPISADNTEVSVNQVYAFLSGQGRNFFNCLYETTSQLLAKSFKVKSY